MSTGSIPRPARFETWRLAAIYIVLILSLRVACATCQFASHTESDWTAQAIENYKDNVNVPAPRGVSMIAMDISLRAIWLPTIS